MLFFVVSKEDYGVCVLHFDNIISNNESVQVICIIFCLDNLRNNVIVLVDYNTIERNNNLIVNLDFFHVK